MAVLEAAPGGPFSQSINLCTALGGNVDSTNTADRGGLRRSALLRIASVAGTTVTVNIVGSADGTNFYNVAYSASATPETVAVAALVITTTTTSYFVLRPEHPWRFLKLVLSANTGMTLTADLAA